MRVPLRCTGAGCYPQPSHRGGKPGKPCGRGVAHTVLGALASLSSTPPRPPVTTSRLLLSGWRCVEAPVVGDSGTCCRNYLRARQSCHNGVPRRSPALPPTGETCSHARCARIEGVPPAPAYPTCGASGCAIGPYGDATVWRSRQHTGYWIHTHIYIVRLPPRLECAPRDRALI